MRPVDDWLLSYRSGFAPRLKRDSHFGLSDLTGLSLTTLVLIFRLALSEAGRNF